MERNNELKIEFNAMSREGKIQFLLNEVKATVFHNVSSCNEYTSFSWFRKWDAIKEHYYKNKKTTLHLDVIELLIEKLDMSCRIVVDVLVYINTDMIENGRCSQSVLLNKILRLRRLNKEDDICQID